MFDYFSFIRFVRLAVLANPSQRTTFPVHKTNFEVLILGSHLKYHHRLVSLLQRKTVDHLTVNNADLLRNIFGSAVTLKPLDLAISMLLANVLAVT